MRWREPNDPTRDWQALYPGGALFLLLLGAAVVIALILMLYPDSQGRVGGIPSPEPRPTQAPTD
jgi:hypothetical protein